MKNRENRLIPHHVGTRILNFPMAREMSRDDCVPNDLFSFLKLLHQTILHTTYPPTTPTTSARYTPHQLLYQPDGGVEGKGREEKQCIIIIFLAFFLPAFLPTCLSA